MKKVLGVILGGLLLLPVVSNAADAQKAADNKKPVNSWTCEDFPGCGRILPANCSRFC